MLGADGYGDRVSAVGRRRVAIPAKISIGTASLRGAGLHLAVNAAVATEQQEWTRDQATHMLGSDEIADVHAAAAALVQLLPKTLRGT